MSTRTPCSMDTRHVDPSQAELVAATVARLQRQIATFARRDVELTVEDIAPLLASTSQLRRAGVIFDPLLCVLLDKLPAQAFGTDDNSDEDGHDQTLDLTPLAPHDIEDEGPDEQSDTDIQAGGNWQGSIQEPYGEHDPDEDASDEMIDLDNCDEDNDLAPDDGVKASAEIDRHASRGGVPAEWVGPIEVSLAARFDMEQEQAWLSALPHLSEEVEIQRMTMVEGGHNA